MLNILVHIGEHGPKHLPKELSGVTIFMFYLIGIAALLYVIYLIWWRFSGKK